MGFIKKPKTTMNLILIGKSIADKLQTVGFALQFFGGRLILFG
jgi:hypothetical protein